MRWTGEREEVTTMSKGVLVRQEILERFLSGLKTQSPCINPESLGEESAAAEVGYGFGEFGEGEEAGDKDVDGGSGDSHEEELEGR